MQSDIHVLACG